MRTTSTRIACRLGLLALFATGFAAPAQAHVKWFAPYDVHEQPHQLAGMVNTTMLAMAAAALLLLWAASRIEQTGLVQRLAGMFDRASQKPHARMEDFLRATTGAFFVSLWAKGGIILTPELTTDAAWVSWLQLGIAVCMFWRATLPVAAAGMAALYVYGIGRFGLFHMMDYPIFLGIAAYHALSASSSEKWRNLRWDVLRIGAAVTLMWASVEKWAYPHWTDPILDAHAELTFGLGHGPFMIIAGIVEFSLAFGLLGSSLIRRASALLLGVMFTAAIFKFGKIDAIGHLMIIAILVAVMFDARTRPQQLTPARTVATYMPALVGSIAFYYGSHALLIGMVH